MKEENKEVVNWYSVIPKSLQPKYHNPNFKETGIVIPFRLLIIGQTGSKKTNTLLTLIYKMNDTFGEINIITKDASEPLYTYLKSKIEEGLTVSEGIENTPSPEDLDEDFQHLIVWDDMCLEKDQKIVDEYMIRGRKVAKGVSCVYISQSYFKIPKTTRLQATYIILKKLSCQRDLSVLLSDFQLSIDKDRLMKLYRECTREPDDFLLIDLHAPVERRFRKNFKTIINIDDEQT